MWQSGRYIVVASRQGVKLNYGKIIIIMILIIVMIIISLKIYY